jgi:hypothetical protein
MRIPDEILDELCEDPIRAAVTLVERCETVFPGPDKTAKPEAWERELEVCLDIFGAFKSLLEAAGDSIDEVPLSGDVMVDATELWDAISRKHVELKKELKARQAEIGVLSGQRRIQTASEEMLERRLGLSFRLSEDEKKHIQFLIDRIRGVLTNTKSAPAGHRRRVLRRLERLQAELYEQESRLEQLQGIALQVGLTIRAFYDQTEPVIQDVKEILGLLLGVQARGEKLTGQLTPPMPDPVRALPEINEEECGEDSDAK